MGPGAWHPLAPSWVPPWSSCWRVGSCCDSGGSCFTCDAELDFSENNCHCVQASTWHAARDGSNHDGTAHTVSFGSCVHIRADWTTCNPLSVSVEGRVCSGDGFFGLAAYGSFVVRSWWFLLYLLCLRPQGIVVQGLESTKCSGIHPGFDVPVVLPRQVTRLMACAQAQGRGRPRPQGHGSL